MSRLVDLRTLISSRSSEVSTMIGAIKGESGGPLWTAQLRASTRGGKCMIMATEETSDRE
jgi:hypothetical protein